MPSCQHADSSGCSLLILFNGQVFRTSLHDDVCMLYNKSIPVHTFEKSIRRKSTYKCRHVDTPAVLHAA